MAFDLGAVWKLKTTLLFYDLEPIYILVRLVTFNCISYFIRNRALASKNKGPGLF